MVERFTQSGRQIRTIHKTTAEDGATIEYQTSGRDFWVTTLDGEEKQCILGRGEENDLDHLWWRAVRKVRNLKTAD